MLRVEENILTVVRAHRAKKSNTLEMKIKFFNKRDTLLHNFLDKKRVRY